MHHRSITSDRGNNMRIIAGKWRARRLAQPDSMDIRPTTDRAKEGLFNTINYYIEGSDFLDLFSGATSIAFEAKSRGANRVVAVDSSAKSKRLFQTNENKINSGIEFYQADVSKYLEREYNTYDYIFLDPPYDFEYQKLDEIITLALTKLNADGQVILEFPTQRNLQFSAGHIFKQKKYGKSSFYFIEERNE